MVSQAPEAQRHMGRGWAGQSGEPTGHTPARAARKAVQWVHGTRGRTCVQQSSLHQSSEVQTGSLISHPMPLLALSGVCQRARDPGLGLPLLCNGLRAHSARRSVQLHAPCKRPSRYSLFSGTLPSCYHQTRKRPIHCVVSPHQHKPAAQLKTKPTAGDCQRRSLC